MSIPNIIDFCTDDQLLDLEISPAQAALLRAIYGLSLSEEQMALYERFTGRETPPDRPIPEVTVVAGARSGKDSRIAAPIVCYEALFGGHEERLDDGERGMIPLVAQDRRAARIAFGYIESYLTGSPLLAGRVQDVKSREIELDNGISIMTFPCTLRSLRGWSVPVAVMDELGFYRVEGEADADVEVQASIRRGQISFPGAKLVKISTPYMKSGVLWEDFSQHYGHDSPDILVWRAPTREMNPTVPEERLERERRRDPERFAREYEAKFSDGLTSFLPWEWIDRAVVPERGELPPRDLPYVAAVDPSGGGADAFTLAIAHPEGAGPEAPVVVDLVRGWSRAGGSSPDLRGVVSEIADLLRRYGVGFVVGDRYAAGWVRQAFEAEAITYMESPWTKSEAYLEVLPLFSQTRLELPDDSKLVGECQALERRTRSGGRDRIDHPRGGSDDYANVCALAVLAALEGGGVQEVDPREEVLTPEETGQMFGGMPDGSVIGSFF